MAYQYQTSTPGEPQPVQRNHYGPKAPATNRWPAKRGELSYNIIQK